MKRVIAILLCLLLVLCGTTACKPDTLTNPVVITDPDEQPQETPMENQAADQPQLDAEEAPEAEQPEETPEAEAEQPAPEAEQAPQADAEQQPAAAAPLSHPFAAEGFWPSTETEGTLKLSGLTKKTDAAAALKERTIVLFTAADQPTFNYVNQKGVSVSEWDWMKALAESYGFTLKLTVKNADTSLKAQRVALYAGKKLSLLQFGEKDLAVAMTLAQSAEGYLADAASDGISKAVLAQSNQTIFAPKGMVKSLWYNTALLPQGTNPAALAKENKWTIETYKAIYNASAENGILPQQTNDELAWITLSGKSPLTLLDGKLDSNLNAKTTRELWADLKAARAGFKTFTPAAETEYDLKLGNAAMTFTATPERAEEMVLQSAPLPSMKEGTAGTVTFAGTFMALPRYQPEADAAAALTFAELWCNRYTEARAADLFELGFTAEDYVNYVDFAEANGYLIFRSAEIEGVAATLLKGAWDSTINQENEYSKIRTQITALIDRHNLYY